MSGSHRPPTAPGQDSPVHRLPAHVKIVALTLFVISVVAVPRGAWWAHGIQALAVLALVAAARLRAATVLRRMTVEIPFVLFALLMPFVATGPRVTVGPLSLAQEGLIAGASLLVKATLGVAVAVVLGATTSQADLVRGFETLRLPGPLVQIMGLMARYTEVVTGELQRMRIARESRGAATSSVRAWPAMASTLGALFVRSFERGERVHLAMLSRGYAGSLPRLDESPASAADWARGGLLPAVGALACAAAWVVTR